MNNVQTRIKSLSYRLKKSLKVLLNISFLVVTFQACSETDEDRKRSLSSLTIDANKSQEFVRLAEVQPDFADFADIRKRKQLRVLIPLWENSQTLPREGLSLDVYRDIVRQFARRYQLKTQWIMVEKRAELIPALLSGHGDLIARNLTITSSRSEKVAFTVPIESIKEVAIAAKTQAPFKSVNELNNKVVSVPRSTAYVDTLKTLQSNSIKVEIDFLESGLSPDQIASKVNKGEINYTILDAPLVDDLLVYRDDIHKVWTFDERKSLAWAVRKEQQELLVKLNAFLTEQILLRSRIDEKSGDWDQIKKTKTLRVITRNAPSTYYIWKGELMGFEYELVRRFANVNKLNIEMVIPPDEYSLIDWLKEGHGDMIAAGWAQTDERMAQNVIFSRPYNYISEVLVSHRDAEPVKSVRALEGRNVHIKQSSSYLQTLMNIQKQGINVKIDFIPETFSWDDILDAIENKEISLAVIDSNLLAIELRYRDKIKQDLSLIDKIPHRFAFSASSQTLKDRVDAFIKKEYRGLHYNIFHKRYFGTRKKIGVHAENRLAKSGVISPYDKMIRDIASNYGFDWRLISSQMFQESRFNPKARSPAGAIGLMQVLPRTAKQVGIDNLTNPKNSIVAGIKYLAWVRDRFDEQLPVDERTFFALAAYNAGAGHVNDARIVARKVGLDPNKWFGNVEKAIVLLAKPQYYKKARYGYCRGHEPATYVSKIYKRYLGYVGAGIK